MPTAPTAPPEGVVTPEAVLLELPTAGLASRALAFGVDLAIRGTTLVAVLAGLGALGVVIDETLAVVLGLGGVFGALLVYPAVFEVRWQGRTPGKRLLGVRVVTVEGGPVRTSHAAIRAALGLVDFLLGAGALAVLSALASPRGQRLGDLAAGTVVVRDRPSGRENRPVSFEVPTGWEAWTESVDVRRLPPDLAVVVRSFLLRVHELSPTARAGAAASLASSVAGELGLPDPAGADSEALLVAILAAHQRSGASTPAARDPREALAWPEPTWGRGSVGAEGSDLLP